jgi:hypothetical protein
MNGTIQWSGDLKGVTHFGEELVNSILSILEHVSRSDQTLVRNATKSLP